MMTSFLRSEMVRWFSSSSEPPSPVRNQPSWMASAVASGWFQYPSSTTLLRASTSPSPSTRRRTPTAGRPGPPEPLRPAPTAESPSYSWRLRFMVRRGAVSVSP